MLFHVLVYVLSFAGIWLGAGLATKAVQNLSRRLGLSSFSLSFLILGFFTSVSELSVGVNSVILKDPEIYVGNLIGASIVLLLMVIPFLALAANSINIQKEFSGFNLVVSLLVIAAPVILVIDGQVTKLDSVISIILYVFLFICIERKNGILGTTKKIAKVPETKIVKAIVKIIVGVSIIFISSRFIVGQTLYFSELLKVSPFMISLLLISIGTNVPELSLVFRSLVMRNNQVAFGDYIGSAAFNTFLFGFLTLLYGNTVSLENSYFVSLLFLIAGVILFYHFAHTKNIISRLEGLVLLLFYFSFIVTELLIHF